MIKKLIFMAAATCLLTQAALAGDVCPPKPVCQAGEVVIFKFAGTGLIPVCVPTSCTPKPPMLNLASCPVPPACKAGETQVYQFNNAKLIPQCVTNSCAANANAPTNAPAA